MKRIVIGISVIILFTVAYLLSANWLFLTRYLGFVAGGYDPKTVPMDWYRPTQSLAQGDGATLPVAEPHQWTIPDHVVREVLAFAEQNDTLALIIARGGRIEVEHYWGDADRDTQFNPQSMSKTLAAMLTGIAIDEGAFGSVDDPISFYLHEFRGDARGDVTIRNLLQMSGGLEQIAKDYSPVPWSRGVRQHFGTRFNHWVLQLDLVDEPGSRFDYNNNETNLLGLVLERAVQQRYPEYLSEKIWQPLGLGPARAYLDRPGGDAMKSCCILSRPIDWLKLGQLLLDDGIYEGKRILPPGWVSEMVAPAATFPGYGYQVWLSPITLRGGSIREQPPASPYLWWASEPFAGTVYGFTGFGFHHVWVLPAVNVVVIRAHSREWPEKPWDQSRIPNLLLRGISH